ncbi:phage integrase Arm DNA-binding domain-containing protein [Vibrio parahaemolyticus]|nr:phage integrase Arm DNA-binding domain-containing protein [Vibrio parahaemolyticus]
MYKQYVENLYQKTDKRNGKTYYSYKHPETGKFIGLGSDKDKAFHAAFEANRIFTERKVDQLHFILTNSEQYVEEVGISAKEWIKKYIDIQKLRLSNKELESETVKTKVYRAQLFAHRFGNKGLKEITTKDIAAVLDEYISAEKLGMARNIRTAWKDVYVEAQYAGEVESGFNPVAHTRSVKVPVKRQRMSPDDLNEIMSTEKYEQNQHLQTATKIGITTALRRTDIVNLKFSDVINGRLYVEISKSNGKTRLSFPLELKSPLLDESLGEIINKCKTSNISSNYIVHHVRNHSGRYKTKCGQKVKPETVTTLFSHAKKQCSPTTAKKNISFHELRSLAAREYNKAGFDTKTLLGHKHQKTSDLYDDERNDDYIMIEIPEQN